MAAAFTAAGIAFEDCGTMDKAVARARALAQAGDSVLLAPATASFDQYSGYDARGDAFAYEVDEHMSLKDRAQPPLARQKIIADRHINDFHNSQNGRAAGRGWNFPTSGCSLPGAR